MKTTLCLAAAALVFAATASAGTPSVAWSTKDMKTAIRALSYPKPHAKKLACKGLGAADTNGRHTSFRCVATYKHHRRRVFYTEGSGLGGWICAGTKLATCTVLHHGFASTSMVAFDGSLQGAAELAARGYVQNRYDTFDTFPAGECTQAAARSWSCPYKLDAGTITVTITLKTAKGGYLVSASAAT